MKDKVEKCGRLKSMGVRCASVAKKAGALQGKIKLC